MKKRIALLSVLGTLLTPNIFLYAWPAVDDIAKKCNFDAKSQKAYQSCSGWKNEDLANRIVSRQVSDLEASCLELRKTCGDDQAFFTRDETNCAAGDYVMIDNQTGLMWLGNANHYNEGKAQNWYEAKNAVDRFNYCGHTDWRLPRINELESLASLSDRPASMLNKIGFTHIRDMWYWSSFSIIWSDNTEAQSMYMSNGYGTTFSKGDYGLVLPVRGYISPEDLNRILCDYYRNQISFNTSHEACRGLPE